MRTQDLTPEQRLEILSRWNAAVRFWWSDRDIDPARCQFVAWRLRYYTADLDRPFATPEAVAHGA